MRSAIARVTLKIIELLGCIACFVTKVITDLEARRVFLRNQKYSREWSLLHNITWSSAGNTFANITYGGFSLITTLMLISRCIDASSSPSIIEKIFLVVGMLCFFAMGGLVLAAFDQVPWELHDNSVILGCLSFFVALVMLYDLADPIARHVTDTTQTDSEYTMPQQQQQRNQSSQQPQPQQMVSASDVDQSNQSTSTQTNQNNQGNQSNKTKLSTATTATAATATGGQTNEAMQHDDVTDEPTAMPEMVVTQTRTIRTTTSHPSSQPPDDIAQNGNYHRGDTIDFVQYQHIPQPEQPIFERVLLPEKKRPSYNKVTTSLSDSHTPRKATIIHQQNVHTSPDDYIPRETHFDSTVSYSHMPKYAAVQRQQTHHQQQQQQQQQHSHHQNHHHHYQQQQQQHHHPPPTHQNLEYSPSYSSPSQMYKLTPPTTTTHNYDEHNDYEHPPSSSTSKRITTTTTNVINDYGRPPSSHFTKSSHDIVGSERYHPHHHHHQQQQQQQPMMVIRNYGHSRPIRTSAATTPSNASISAASVTAVHSQLAEPRRFSHTANDNAYHHRNGSNGNRKLSNHFNQMDSRKNGAGASGGGGGCCGGSNNANDEIDFRKMNSAIRPGFVQSVAKMWDQRAVENSNEFNTIV